jgi:phosphoribosylcarboxyaminoimidazole (NCAIR) mutase
LLALEILGVADEQLWKKLLDFKRRLAEESRAKNANLKTD